MTKCAFCGKNKSNNELQMTARGLYCAECIRISSMFIGKPENIKPKALTIHKIPKPNEIKAELDRYIVGQDEAKKILSVEICNHIKRINRPELNLKKSNAFLVGPTASGKTLFAETISRIIDVPLVISDATTFTEVGYVGKDVQMCLVQLLEKSNYDVKQAEKGIVYIDEADKMVVRHTDGRNGRDIRGEGVQQAFLRMIEGADIEVEIPGKAGSTDRVIINTKNILFIFGGTFDGIGKIVAERVRKGRVKRLVEHEEIPFESFDDYSVNIAPHDIVKYGFIKEFIGRVPMVITLRRLTIEQLLSILTKTENSILKEYINLFSLSGIRLEFSDDALTHVIEQSHKYGVGARGLRGYLSKCLNSVLYDASIDSTEQLIITKEVLMQYNEQ